MTNVVTNKAWRWAAFLVLFTVLFGVSINVGEGPECTPIYQILLGWMP